MAMIAIAAGTALSALGTIGSGDAQARAGQAQNQVAQWQARQIEQQGGQERASAQRAGLEEQRKARLASSRALALAAASGGAADPTVVKIMGDIEGEGEYRKRVALFSGEERVRGLHLGAESRLMEGRMAKAAGKSALAGAFVSATGSALTSGGSLSLLEKYG